MSIFFPSAYVSRMVDYDFVSAYKDGKRLILFDIDNTIVPHDAPADEEAVSFTARLKNMGFRLCCVSNNSQSRVEPFAISCGIDYICRAHKPDTRAIRKAMLDAGVDEHQTIFFGDQIFTDIIGANRAHVESVLVRPVQRSSDPFSVRWKRVLEIPILICCRISKILK